MRAGLTEPVSGPLSFWLLFMFIFVELLFAVRLERHECVAPLLIAGILASIREIIQRPPQ